MIAGRRTMTQLGRVVSATLNNPTRPPLFCPSTLAASSSSSSSTAWSAVSLLVLRSDVARSTLRFSTRNPNSLFSKRWSSTTTTPGSSQSTSTSASTVAASEVASSPVTSATEAVAGKPIGSSANVSESVSVNSKSVDSTVVTESSSGSARSGEAAPQTSTTTSTGAGAAPKSGEPIPTSVAAEGDKSGPTEIPGYMPPTETPSTYKAGSWWAEHERYSGYLFPMVLFGLVGFFAMASSRKANVEREKDSLQERNPLTYHEVLELRRINRLNLHDVMLLSSNLGRVARAAPGSATALEFASTKKVSPFSFGSLPSAIGFASPFSGIGGVASTNANRRPASGASTTDPSSSPSSTDATNPDSDASSANQTDSQSLTFSNSDAPAEPEPTPVPSVEDFAHQDFLPDSGLPLTWLQVRGVFERTFGRDWRGEHLLLRLLRALSAPADAPSFSVLGWADPRTDDSIRGIQFPLFTWLVLLAMVCQVEFPRDRQSALFAVLDPGDRGYLSQPQFTAMMRSAVRLGWCFDTRVFKTNWKSIQARTLSADEFADELWSDYVVNPLEGAKKMKEREREPVPADDVAHKETAPAKVDGVPVLRWTELQNMGIHMA